MAKRGRPVGLGKTPGSGRKKGVPNKVTKAVKDALSEALNDGKGAVAFFKRLKNSKSAEDRRTFANICARLIPTEIVGDKTRPLNVIVQRFSDAG